MPAALSGIKKVKYAVAGSGEYKNALPDVEEDFITVEHYYRRKGKFFFRDGNQRFNFQLNDPAEIEKAKTNFISGLSYRIKFSS